MFLQARNSIFALMVMALISYVAYSRVNAAAPAAPKPTASASPVELKLVTWDEYQAWLKQQQGILSWLTAGLHTARRARKNFRTWSNSARNMRKTK